jgi:diacylglycerol kinase (ATP)
MQSNGRQKLLFVINPRSGKKAPDWEKIIHRHFAQLPHQVILLKLDGNNDAEFLKQKINELSPDKVIAVGGDGTIKLVAENLIRRNIPMGIIPAGSANGMAKELAIPEGHERALETLLGWHTKIIDLIFINNEWCMHLSDIGLNAQLVKYFQSSKKRGWWGYARSSLKVLWNRHLMHLQISSDTESIVRHAFMVVVANARKYGTGATINPEGSVEDGFFEVVIVRRLSWAELLKMLISHKPFDPEKIEVIKTRKATIACKRKYHFQIDGEYRGRVNLVEAKIETHQVPVIIPGR